MANVIIVDDSILIRNKLKALLTRHGHQVVAEAENGIQAIRRYKEHSPDLLTMDITMPEMDGITALKKILEMDSNAKIIMLSALSQKLLVLDALKTGAKHFIVKPIDEVKFEQIICEVLESKIEDKSKNLDESTCKSEKNQESGDNEVPLDNRSITFENINGVIVVKIGKEPLEEDLRTFMLTMNGIVNIKHVHTMFDFEKINNLSEDFCKRLDMVLGSISQVEGKYILSSINHTFGTYLQKFNLQYFKK